MECLYLPITQIQSNNTFLTRKIPLGPVRIDPDVNVRCVLFFSNRSVDSKNH